MIASTRRRLAIPASAVDALATYLGQRAGLAFPGARRHALLDALEQSMRVCSTQDANVVLARLPLDATLYDGVIKHVTVGETYFFRDPNQLRVIARRVIPELLHRRPPGHRLRVWSAGCATGEEPYTLAILARQHGVAPMPLIVGTDLSAISIAAARRGLYGTWALRGLDATIRDAYFRHEGNRWWLSETIRNDVAFRPHNLLDDTDPPDLASFGDMDLVVCRNVLIYLDPPSVARAMRRMVGALADGGWLVLGASDPPLISGLPCTAVHTEAGVMYRRTSRQHAATLQSFPEWTVQPPRRVVVVPPAPFELPPVLRAQVEPPAPAEPPPPPEAPTVDEVPPVDAGAIRALADQGVIGDALARCEAAIASSPGTATLHALHAELLLVSGNAEDAVRVARGATYLDPTCADAQLALGRALAAAGAKAEAGRAYRRTLALLREREAHLTDPTIEPDARALGAMIRGHLLALEERHE